jgi:hypothetical protein
LINKNKKIMEKLTSKLTIDTVKIVDAMSFGTHYHNYGKWDRVRHSEIYKSLLINGTLEDGQKVWFFTPSCEIGVCEGILNYETLHTQNGWMKEQKGELIGHENPLYYKPSEANGYEGSTEVPVYIESTDKIVPAVEVGQEITLAYVVKRACKNNTLQLYYTKIVN